MDLSKVSKLISPPSEPSRFDTGLTFTDILFGLVIAEIFMRLQNWGVLPWINRWQLITATALVLGSWIGFRRSRNRTRYELKFFNLPFARFLLDQTMVLLYFRIATLTPNGAPFGVDATKLVHKTTLSLLIVFGLYLFWDLGAVWMARSGPSSTPRYPVIDDDTNKKLKSVRSNVDGWGLTISTVAAAAILVLFLAANHPSVRKPEAEEVFVFATIILLVYRWLKDVRSSYKHAADDPLVVPVVDLATNPNVDLDAHAVGRVVTMVASGKESHWKRIR